MVEIPPICNLEPNIASCIQLVSGFWHLKGDTAAVQIKISSIAIPLKSIEALCYSSLMNPFIKRGQLFCSLLLCLILGHVTPSRASQTTDSLWQSWQNKQLHDTLRLEALSNLLMAKYLPTNIDSMEHYARVMMDFAIDKHPVYVARSIQMQGIVASERGDLVKALELFERAMHRYEALGREERRISALSNVARTHGFLANTQLAVKYYGEVLDYSKRKGDDRGLAKNLNNVGLLYFNQEDHAKAKEYYQESIKHGQKVLELQSLAHAHGNLALMFAYEQNADSVFHHVDRASEYYLLMGDSLGLSSLWASKGILQQKIGNYDEALETFERVLNISKAYGHRQMVVSALNQIASLYLDMKDYRQAGDFANRGLALAEEIPSLHHQEGAYNMLSKIAEANGDYQHSLEMYRQSRVMRDSLLKEENRYELIRQELKFSYLKKAVADSVRNEEKAKIKDAVIAKERAEKEEYRSRQVLLFGGIGVLLVFLAVVYNRFIVTKKQKGIIEEQKQQVEEQKVIIEEAAKTKLELERLKQERLKADLTNAAREITRRQEWLEQFKAKLSKVKSFGNKNKELNEAFVDVTNQMQLDARNQEFYKNIEVVNQEFFQRLREMFPNITQNERELCGLIRLSLTTKDIANVRNVEPHSIRIARSRLKKRLGLEKEENLHDYLQGL